MATLTLSNLVAGYHYPYAVLQDVSLSVESGQIVAVLGPNGAGKTTTLNTISGILRPWQGQVRLDDRRIDGEDASTIVRLGVAQVPEGRRILPGLTVDENLQMGAYTVGSRAAIEQAREEVLALFPDLRARLRQLGGTLSGGEQEMLAIARALMSSPKILLMDEPSMGLAPLIVARIFEYLVEFRKRGYGVLLVEQNAKLSLDIADIALVLDKGRVVLEGSVSEVRGSPIIAAVYLGGEATTMGGGGRG